MRKSESNRLTIGAGLALHAEVPLGMRRAVRREAEFITDGEIDAEDIRVAFRLVRRRLEKKNEPV